MRYLLILLSMTFSMSQNLNVGSYYKIGNNISLLKQPKASTNVEENAKNIISTPTGMLTVKVLSKKRVKFQTFYEVMQIRDGVDKGKAFIWSKQIDSFFIQTKEKAYYVKPKEVYNYSEKDLKKAENIKGEIIGKWLDDDASSGSIIILRKTNSNYYIDINYRDNTSSTESLKSSNTQSGTRLDYNNSFGEFYLLKDNKHLSLHDNYGLIKKLKPIEK